MATILGGRGVSRADFQDMLHDAILEMFRRVKLHRDDGVPLEKWAHSCANYAALETRRCRHKLGIGYSRHRGRAAIVSIDEAPGRSCPPTGEQRVALGEALDALSTAPDRVADTVARYAVGEYLKDIGASYGVTEARACQLLRLGRDAIEREVG
jgi:DNA-directed RNA polymerase specialized sigma24 family protein